MNGVHRGLDGVIIIAFGFRCTVGRYEVKVTEGELKLIGQGQLLVCAADSLIGPPSFWSVLLAV